jgi:hypothetical protein
MNFFILKALLELELRTFIYIDLYHTPPLPAFFEKAERGERRWG